MHPLVASLCMSFFLVMLSLNHSVQVPADAGVMQNPFCSLYIISYYQRTWFPLAALWSFVQTPRDTTLHISANVQEYPIHLVKSRLGSSSVRSRYKLSTVVTKCVIKNDLQTVLPLLSDMAVKFRQSPLQSSLNRQPQKDYKAAVLAAAPAATPSDNQAVMPQQASHRRNNPDQFLAEQLGRAHAQGNLQLTAAYSPFQLVWDLMSGQDLAHRLLHLCFLLVIEGHVSAETSSQLWKRKFTITQLRKWTNVNAHTRTDAKGSKVPTSATDPQLHIRCTLQLYASTIQSKPDIVTGTEEEFCALAAAKLQSVRQMVQVCVCVCVCA